MTVNTNPQAVLFVNEKLRPACDRVISALRTLRQLSTDYSADGIGALVAGTTDLQAEQMGDGAITDGRTILTGYDVDLAVGQINTLVAYINGQSGMEAALTKPSVNTGPVF